MKPDDFSNDRARNLRRWQRNRDHTNGVDAVKDAGERYLPRVTGDTSNIQFQTFTDPQTGQDYQVPVNASVGMSLSEYERHKLSTEYFPAAARTLQSHVSLVFRKQPKLKAPDAFKALEHIITADGLTLEELARWCLREYMITNDGGLLVDSPAETGVTLADSIARDLRPFIARYCAENIRNLIFGVVGGRKRLTAVHLMDDEVTARHLLLIDGVYTVRLWKKVEASWMLLSEYVPTKKGQALNSIPFIWLNDGEDGAAFDDLCSLNLTHYQHSSKLDTALLWLSAPIPYVTGVSEDIQLSTSPGNLWRFENENTKCDYLEFSGEGIGAIERQLDRLELHMAMLGSRMLGVEKPGVESAEVVARRQSSENSIIAASARHVSAKVAEGGRWVADWMDMNGAEIDFALSTDFIPTPIEPQLLAQLTTLNQAGKLTDQELFDALQRGEIIDETVDFETHQALLESTLIDRPVTNGPIG